MSTTLIICITLAVLAYAGYRTWQVWNERFAGRGMREQEREMALLTELRKAHIEAPETVLVMDRPLPKKPVAASSPARQADTAATPAPAPVPSDAGRPHPPVPAMLDAAGRVVFYMLRIALPDHEILARVDAAALVGPNEAAPPRAMLDFVVCQRDFSPVAVIVLQRSEDALRDRAAALLEQRGLRVLRWAITALPERSRVREAVLGSATTLPAAAHSTSAA